MQLREIVDTVMIRLVHGGRLLVVRPERRDDVAPQDFLAA
jgi:hypothetical protein